MLKKIKKTLVCMLTVFSFNVLAENIVIPDIATAGVRALSVHKEKQYGDFFMRKVRASNALAYDPAINEYLNTIGNRLVLKASNVYFPFEFFLSADKSLNASAFLGGKIQVNAGLFHYTKTEDEFASVLAHEVSHVTQRHIARFIEAQQDIAPVSIATVIGAIALAIINPAVGMAAISTSTGMVAQAGINYTRDHEYEADRIGIQLLNSAGFNAMGMSDLFRRLLSMQGKINPAYSMLIDHPLSEVRVAEAYNRARNLPTKKYSKNPNYMLAKARVDVRYMDLNLKELKTRLLNTAKVNPYYKNYALALIAFEHGDYKEAREHLLKIELKYNDFVLDLLTDIDLMQGQTQNAIQRLENIYPTRTNDTAVIINLANACIKAKNYKRAAAVLQNYLKKKPEDLYANDLLASAYAALKDRCQTDQTLAWSRALASNYNQANAFLANAFHTCRGTERDRVRAKVKQYNQMRDFDEKLAKN